MLYSYVFGDLLIAIELFLLPGQWLGDLDKYAGIFGNKARILPFLLFLKSYSGLILL